MISSSSNKQIKELIQLQTKAKVRNKEGLYVIEGIKMFLEVKEQAFHCLKKTYISESFYEDISNNDTTDASIGSKITHSDLAHIEYEVVSDKVFNEVSETINPQGIMAIVKQPKYELSDIIDKEEVRLVLLEDLRDPGNLGTIIRTAEGAGVTGIILTKNSVDIFNPKVIRSTMGAIYRVPFVYVEDMVETLHLLSKHQIQVYAAHLKATHYYDEVVYGTRSGILIGNEANGLSDVVAKAAGDYIKIPMEGQVESLNAGVATAILMYEIYRQSRSTR